MFYFIPRRGTYWDFICGTIKGDVINVLDTEDNVVECVPLCKLYNSKVTFRNARRSGGKFLLYSENIKQRFSGVIISINPRRGFKIGEIIYSYEAKITPKTKHFRRLFLRKSDAKTPICILRNKMKETSLYYFVAHYMMKFSVYYILVAEIYAKEWSMTEFGTEFNTPFFLVFDKDFKFLGCHLSGWHEVFEVCTPVDKALAAKLVFADSSLYF